MTVRVNRELATGKGPISIVQIVMMGFAIFWWDVIDGSETELGGAQYELDFSSDTQRLRAIGRLFLYSGMPGTPGNLVCVTHVWSGESDWLLDAMICLQDDMNVRQAAIGSQYGKAAALRPLLH